MNITSFIMILIGLVTGVVTGLTGASGVMVVVPLLTMLLHFSIHEAVGTSLLVDVIAPLMIAYTYFRHGRVDIKSGVWIALGSILGAQLGSLFASGISSGGLSNSFGLFLLLMGALTWKNGFNSAAVTGRLKKFVRFETTAQRTSTSLILGVLIGIMTGVLGAGGGGMILLVLTFVLDFPLHTALGTSMFIMAITALSGAVGYALHGNINLLAGVVIGLSAIVGGTLSARFANRVSEQVLSRAVSVIFVALGITMSALNLNGVMHLV